LNEGTDSAVLIPAYLDFAGNATVGGSPAAGWGTGADIKNLHAFHSFAVSRSPIVYRNNFAPIDPDFDDDHATDIAFIQLDERMPGLLIPPQHPALDNEVCPGDDSFSGTAIGYGPTGYDCTGGGIAGAGGSGALTCTPYGGGVRNFALSVDWFASTTANGRFYGNTFANGTYKGSLKGDSGGAMVRGLGGGLCGIASSINSHDYFLFGTTTTKYAAIDYERGSRHSAHPSLPRARSGSAGTHYPR
jgi:hypothetical protein